MGPVPPPKTAGHRLLRLVGLRRAAPGVRSPPNGLTAAWQHIKARHRLCVNGCTPNSGLGGAPWNAVANVGRRGLPCHRA